MNELPADALRIALVTPWPPQHTGIADFSADLAMGLADAGHRVVVFTHTADALPRPGIDLIVVPDGWDGADLADFDHRLYQLGNHVGFHGWMLNAIARHPGVVQVHDIVMHHVVAGLTCALENWAEYVRAVDDWYGPDARARAERTWRGVDPLLWEMPEVIDYPFFEIFVQHAQAAIVHSRFAATRIARAFPQLPIAQVMQTYRHPRSPAPRTALRRIGVFGGVQANKKIDWLLEAFRYLDRTMEGIEVTIVGKVEAHSEPLVAEARALRHASIRFAGRTTEEEFLDELDRTDLCIALRHPTMGETSAVVMRAVQKGIPTIVNDTGWYAELPAEVLKAPIGNTPHFIASTLQRMVAEPDAYPAWAGACHALVDTLDISHTHMCAEIVHFLRTHEAQRRLAASVNQAVCAMGFTGDAEEIPILASLGERFAAATRAFS